MREGRATYLLIIALLVAFILYILSRGNILPPIQATPTPSPTQQLILPSPTFVIPTPFPTPFIPDNLMGDGGSELRTIVNEGGNISSIASSLQRYEWVTGDLDLSRATALYLYDNAWAATTYTENYIHNMNLTQQFLYSGLVATIFMNSASENGFCGIRTNANGDNSYIDVLLYRNGRLRTIVVAEGETIKDESNLVYSQRGEIQTDGRAFAAVYMFFDQPGLTVIANYLILGVETSPSQRIRIDFDPLALAPSQGPLMLRAGTDYGETTYCAYGDFYQYPIRHR